MEGGRNMTDRYVSTGGPYWGAHFENLCRGHRVYLLRDPRENGQIDLYTGPNGEYDENPPSVQDCTLCNKRANEHGYGVHGVSIYGCPNCGGDVTKKTRKGRKFNVCYECNPTLLKRLVSLVTFFK